MRHFLKDDLEPFSYLIYVAALLIGLQLWKSNERKVLLFYYTLAAILIFLATYKIDVDQNRSLYNVFFLSTISILSFYYRSILHSKHLKRLVVLIFIVNIGIYIEALVSKNIYSINNYSYATIYLSVVSYTLFYFWQELNNVGEHKLLEQLEFYFAAGHLLYFLSCFFIILFYDNVGEKQRAILWSSQNIILFFSSVITLSGSIWTYYHTKSS